MHATANTEPKTLAILQPDKKTVLRLEVKNVRLEKIKNQRSALRNLRNLRNLAKLGSPTNPQRDSLAEIGEKHIEYEKCIQNEKKL